MKTIVVEKPSVENDTINLFDVGVLINLHIKTWSGRKMLTRQDLVILGYNPDKLPKDIVNLGRKLMVPKIELQTLTQIEQRARKSLERWSVPFGISNSHFVPNNMLPEVEQQINELKKEFFTRVDSFISRFDTLVSKIREAHPDFWEKCLKGNYPNNPKKLRKRFQFDWYTFKIAGIDSIQSVNVKDVITQQEIDNEKKNELRDKMKLEVGNFVEEYVSSMRKETVKFCDLMSARINGKPFANEKESKKLTPKSIACFRKYVDRFKSMNVFGDKEIDKMLSEFKNVFLDPGVLPQHFESSTVKNSVCRALENIRIKAAQEGQSHDGFIGELRRNIVL